MEIGHLIGLGEVLREQSSCVVDRVRCEKDTKGDEVAVVLAHSLDGDDERGVDGLGELRRGERAIDRGQRVNPQVADSYRRKVTGHLGRAAEGDIARAASVLIIGTARLQRRAGVLIAPGHLGYLELSSCCVRF